MYRNPSYPYRSSSIFLTAPGDEKDNFFRRGGASCAEVCDGVIGIRASSSSRYVFMLLKGVEGIKLEGTPRPPRWFLVTECCRLLLRDANKNSSQAAPS